MSLQAGAHGSPGQAVRGRVPCLSPQLWLCPPSPVSPWAGCRHVTPYQVAVVPACSQLCTYLQPYSPKPCSPKALQQGERSSMWQETALSSCCASMRQGDADHSLVPKQGKSFSSVHSPRALLGAGSST